MTTTLKFNPGNHTYRLDGKSIRGVTGLMKPASDPRGLIQWAGNSVADYVVDHPDEIADMRARLSISRLRWELRNVPDTLRDTAAVRGTEVHAVAHAIVQGQEVEVPERLMPYVDGYLDWLRDWRVEEIASEFRVASRKHWYAGTADLLARVTNEAGTRTALVDLKTGKWPYGETCCQTAAYACADFYVRDGEEVPLPPIDMIGLVHVTPDGTDFYDLGDIPTAFDEFLHAAALAKTMTRRKRLTEVPL